MKIENKILFSDYWKNEMYQNKKPKINSNNRIEMVGDNIYKPKSNEILNIFDFEQIKNLFHNTLENKRNDLIGKYVLFSNTFYYFGSKPIEIPENIMPKVPKFQAAHGIETKDEQKKKLFIEYIKNNYKIGVYNKPHKWKEKDKSWITDIKYINC